MKKIISFKQDLAFETRIAELTSISLEHKIISSKEELISGEFEIKGQYKMTEGSINREEYNFVLPFDIALNSKYDIKSVNIDIDNFTYEIKNNEILSVVIDLLFEANEITKPEPTIDDGRKEVETKTIKEENNIIDEPKENVIPTQKQVIKLEEEMTIENDEEDIKENNETFVTYYVYIVKEDDNIEKIMEKYEVSKEDLELYNDINNLKTGDKVIIPVNGK